MTEREAIVLFLREEEAKFQRHGADPKMSEAAWLRLSEKASILRTMAAYIERGDHLIGHDVDVDVSACDHQCAADRDE